MRYLLIAAFSILFLPNLAFSTVTPAKQNGEISRGQLSLSSEESGLELLAPLLSTKIDVSVTGPIARVSLTQRFVNTSNEWVEGIYKFPLPENSAVDTLRMRIGGRLIEGVIKEREEARAIYEVAKAEGQGAALIEQEQPNLFTNSIANIGPNETVIIQIEFQQYIAPKDGMWELRMPLVVSPRYIQDIDNQDVTFEGGVLRVSGSDVNYSNAPLAYADGSLHNPVVINVNLEASFHIGQIESPFHTVKVNNSSLSSARVELDGAVPADRDFVLRWKPKSEAIYASLFTEQVAGEDHFLLTLTPPSAFEENEPSPREVIFVLDISGSMGGTSIRQAKQGLEMALLRLKPEDTFNVIFFNHEYTYVSPAPRAATPANISEVVSKLRNIKADGGTNMLPALKYALQDATPDNGRLRQVIFMTDGSVSGETAMFALIQRKLGRSRLFTVGIGSAPNSYFMTKAAEMGRGSHIFIGNLNEVQERMTDLFAKIESPAITELKIELPDGVVLEQYPNPLPDLYAGDPMAISFKTNSRIGSVVITGMRGGSPWRLLAPAFNTPAREGVAKLWARMKISSLESLRMSPDMVSSIGEETLEAELLSTALEYGLVSRLTSLVAVDKTRARPYSQGYNTTNIALNLPKGWDPAAFSLAANEDPHLYIENSRTPIADRYRRSKNSTRVALAATALNWSNHILLELIGVLFGLVVLLMAIKKHRRARTQVLS